MGRCVVNGSGVLSIFRTQIRCAGILFANNESDNLQASVQIVLGIVAGFILCGCASLWGLHDGNWASFGRSPLAARQAGVGARVVVGRAVGARPKY